MVRLISHSSMLRVDDVRLKGRPMAARFCGFCELAAQENARHLVMECPRWQARRNVMFREIGNIDDGSGQAILGTQCDLLLVLLGKSVCFSMEQMCKLWHIAMVHISGMYNERVREGIG